MAKPKKKNTEPVSLPMLPLRGLMVNASHLVALRKAVKNILYTVSRSNAMNGMGNGVEYAYVMPYWQMVVFGLDAVVLLLCVVRGICLHKKRKTQKQMA